MNVNTEDNQEMVTSAQHRMVKWLSETLHPGREWSQSKCTNQPQDWRCVSKSCSQETSSPHQQSMPHRPFHSCFSTSSVTVAGVQPIMPTCSSRPPMFSIIVLCVLFVTKQIKHVWLCSTVNHFLECLWELVHLISFYQDYCVPTLITASQKLTRSCQSHISQYTKVLPLLAGWITANSRCIGQKTGWVEAVFRGLLT